MGGGGGGGILGFERLVNCIVLSDRGGVGGGGKQGLVIGV